VIWPALHFGIPRQRPQDHRVDGVSAIEAGATTSPLVGSTVAHKTEPARPRSESDQDKKGVEVGLDGLEAPRALLDVTVAGPSTVTAATGPSTIADPAKPPTGSADSSPAAGSATVGAAPADDTGALSTATSIGSDTTAGQTRTRASTPTAAAVEAESTTTKGSGSDGPCFAPSFRDDFNGESLSSDWQVYRAKGSHSPHAIRRAEAISVADGLLTITARNDQDGTLFSGGLRHTGSQRYGKYSFRVRTDADMTNSTSGVVLTWPTSNNQARDGEHNLYETLKAPGRRSPFYSFIHEPFDDKADGISQKRFVHQADATQWQQITAEWTPDYIQITRSGPGATGAQTQRLDEDGSDRITDATHFLAIQLDLFKGSFPDDRQVTMEVDWLEIWSYCG
jgi:hypothetical protein